MSLGIISGGDADSIIAWPARGVERKCRRKDKWHVSGRSISESGGRRRNRAASVSVESNHLVAGKCIERSSEKKKKK